MQLQPLHVQRYRILSHDQMLAHDNVTHLLDHLVRTLERSVHLGWQRLRLVTLPEHDVSRLEPILRLLWCLCRALRHQGSLIVRRDTPDCLQVLVQRNHPLVGNVRRQSISWQLQVRAVRATEHRIQRADACLRVDLIIENKENQT